MDIIVQNDYDNYPGDKQDLTGKDDFLFGKQSDGSYVIPPQSLGGAKEELKLYENKLVMVRGKVSYFMFTIMIFFLIWRK
jgi:hypothetical protein